jgi:hypothetical protein
MPLRSKDFKVIGNGGALKMENIQTPQPQLGELSPANQEHPR